MQWLKKLVFPYHLFPFINLSHSLSLFMCMCVSVSFLYIYLLENCFLFFLSVVQIKMDVSDGFCYFYHFIGLVLLLILRASAIVVADIGPQFLPLGVHRYTHCIICIQHPFVSLCFISLKVADWNSIGAGITLKCSKNVWNLFEKYFSQRLTSTSCSHGNSLFWSNDSRSKCHTYCTFN